MRKLIALVVMLAAVPAMASVDIGASASMVDANTALVTITYDATSETNLVRAFALDIAIVGDPNINVIDVNCVNGDYLIYPGSNGIEISGGAVTSYGSCACNAGDHPDTLGGVGTDDGVTVEMASLYEAGVDPAPGKGPATLAEITIQGCGDANVVVTENAIRGGVVMEDPDEVVTVNLPADVELTLECAGCSCYGDIADSNGVAGNIDGIVDIGDFNVFLMALGVAPGYTITPVPAGMECADLSNSDGTVLGPDGTLDIGDFNVFLMHLANYAPSYSAPCISIP